jgi:UDP-N-acetylmuramoylalanine--D-glutamate ligase
MAIPESFRAVLDHQHDAGADWPVEPETEMNYDSLQLSGKNVLVLGLGDTGLSCARWLAARGVRVSVADSRAEPPHAGRLAELLPQVPLHTGPFDDALLQSTELLVVSPGVPLADPAVARAVAAGIETVGDVELFAAPSVHSTQSASTRCG